MKPYCRQPGLLQYFQILMAQRVGCKGRTSLPEAYQILLVIGRSQLSAPFFQQFPPRPQRIRHIRRKAQQPSAAFCLCLRYGKHIQVFTPGGVLDEYLPGIQIHILPPECQHLPASEPQRYRQQNRPEHFRPSAGLQEPYNLSRGQCVGFKALCSGRRYHLRRISRQRLKLYPIIKCFMQVIVDISNRCTGKPSAQKL